jgi:hypothetical protein
MRFPPGAAALSVPTEPIRNGYGPKQERFPANPPHIPSHLRFPKLGSPPETNPRALVAVRDAMDVERSA